MLLLAIAQICTVAHMFSNLGKVEKRSNSNNMKVIKSKIISSVPRINKACWVMARHLIAIVTGIAACVAVSVTLPTG